MLLDAVAVHVDRLEDALREVFLPGRGELRDEEVEEDRELFPAGVRVGEDRGEEAVGPAEGLGLPLEVDLAVLVELVVVGRDAGVEDRVEPVAVRPVQVEIHEVIDLNRRVNLIAVEVGLEVVELVGVGLLAEDRRPVVVARRRIGSSRRRS